MPFSHNGWTSIWQIESTWRSKSKQSFSFFVQISLPPFCLFENNSNLFFVLVFNVQRDTALLSRTKIDRWKERILRNSAQMWPSQSSKLILRRQAKMPSAWVKMWNRGAWLRKRPKVVNKAKSICNHSEILTSTERTDNFAQKWRFTCKILSACQLPILAKVSNRASPTQTTAKSLTVLTG